jgi:hypothetical protein
MKRLIIALMALCAVAHADDPLVYVSSWNTGVNRNATGQNLAAQLDRIEEGEPILPVFQLPSPGFGASADPASLARLAELGLAFSVRVNNAANYVADIESIDSWRVAGEEIGRELATIAALVPEPPLVILADNNEGTKAEAGTPERMGALHDAIEAQLPVAWQQVIRHVGYGVGPVSHELGRSGWRESDVRPDRLGAWDGGSQPALYIHSWRTKENDTTVLGPQLFAVNVAYGLRLLEETRADWWPELSIWHGESKGIAETGLTPERYAGYAMLGAFVARPRVLREFLSSALPFAAYEDYTRALYGVAKRINGDATVRRFWERGEPVISSLPSPLWRDRQDLPLEHYRQRVLHTPANPKPARKADGTWDKSIWSLGPEYLTELNVFAAAMVIDDREYLVFAQAPKGPLTDVAVDVPGLGTVTLSVVPPEGDFFYFDATPDAPQEPEIPVPVPGRKPMEIIADLYRLLDELEAAL